MRYRVGRLRIDTERFEISRSGRVRHVEPLVFDLIVFLVSQPGRVVTRDEIVASVWKGRSVSDATISSAIRSARLALADEGDRRGHIRTVRGRGFEFTGEVETEGPPSPADAPPGPTGDATAAATRVSKPVLTVLPFVNQSPDVDEYFADGLTEDIITNLSRFRDLRVIAGASSFRFKGRAVDLGDVREQLGADFAVQGSVRRGTGRVRISVQLVDVATAVQLWGDRYDRDPR